MPGTTSVTDDSSVVRDLVRTNDFLHDRIAAASAGDVR
jgi:hypothetical protein